MTNAFSEQESETFPWWERLHGFWRALPNYNPFSVSSEPGQGLEQEARSMLQISGGQDADDNEVRF